MRTRILANALTIGGGAGVATYARELLSELPAAVDADVRAWVPQGDAHLLVDGVGAVPRRPSVGLRRALDSLRPARDADLFHALDVDVPIRSTGLLVATVHDLGVFDVPGAFSRRKAAAERGLMRFAAHRADALIAVSSFTADRIRARLKREATIVWEAPAAAMSVPDDRAVSRVRTRYGLPSEFVLQLGTIEPRKDVWALASACRDLSLPLVLAGGVAPGSEVPTGAQALGRVDGADIPGLYRAARVTAYVSGYEGFALPPVEALACGGVVVASRVGALPEVLAGYNLLVPAGSGASLTETLRRAWHDDDARADAVQVGGGLVARLSWRRAAQETAAVYRGAGLSC